MLEYFRLMQNGDLKKLPSSAVPAIYALCFDINGQITRVGWSFYAGHRVQHLIMEEAADVKEIWLASLSVRASELRPIARRVQKCLAANRVRNEFFRASMRMVDNALVEALTA